MDHDTLLRITEGYATGSFEELFDVQWTNVESFIKAAYDYVPRGSRIKFAEKVRAAAQKRLSR